MPVATTQNNGATGKRPSLSHPRSRRHTVGEKQKHDVQKARRTAGRKPRGGSDDETIVADEAEAQKSREARARKKERQGIAGQCIYRNQK